MKPFVVLLLSISLLLPAVAEEKSNASDAGLKKAQEDVAKLKVALSEKTPEQLVQSFIPAANNQKFGGYDYYYKFMANLVLIEELKQRGRAAIPSCKQQLGNKTQIYEAVNGPGQTVGQICAEIIKAIEKSDH